MQGGRSAQPRTICLLFHALSWALFGVKMCFSSTGLEVKRVARVNLSQVAFWGGPAVLLQGFSSFHLLGVTFAAVR